MGTSKDGKTLGIHAPKRLIALVEQRANRLGMSKSRFASLILSRWAADGCPAINELDRVMEQAMDGHGSKKKSR